MGFMPSLFGGRAPLQPNGPAPFQQPSDRDRRALFWWLKRNTSVTAIEHNATLWTAFAEEWERWLRSQDNPPEEDITSYKYIVDDQLNYERGLQRLRRGDRGVWLRRSSEGWLGKLNTGLIQRRMELTPAEEHIQHFVSLGVPLSLLRAYFAAHDAAMAVGHQGTYRGLDVSKIDALVFVTSEIAARSVLTSLPFDTPLPEPRWEVSCAPGTRAPRDGIYEMVNDAGYVIGGLRFLVKSQAVGDDDFVEFGPNAGEHQTAFLWRLLWEDVRYKDGTIPAEERHYQTPSESVAIERAARDGANLTSPNLRCEAGHPCPRDGWWSAPAKPDSRRLFALGEVMPELGTDFGTTIWQWDERQN